MSSVFHWTATPSSRKLRAHDALVVVLTQHQDERKRAQALADVAERDARRPAVRSPTCWRRR